MCHRHAFLSILDGTLHVYVSGGLYSLTGCSYKIQDFGLLPGPLEGPSLSDALVAKITGMENMSTEF
jgi:hypothetical protein